MDNDERQLLLKTKEKDNSEPKVHITFADMGIPPSRRFHLTFLGEARHCSDIGLTDRVYITLVLLSITAAAIPTVFQLSTSETQSQDYVFCSVLLVNTVFNVWYILEGVLKERASEIAVLTFSVGINMAYLGVNYANGHRNRLTLARLVVTSAFCPVLVILGIIIISTYYVSRRLIFRTVGANATLQAFYIILLVFQDLLKFDLQLGISSIILAVTFASPMSTQDVTLLSVGGTFAVAWSTLGIWAMPRESKIGAYIFFLLSPAQIAHLTHRLLRNNTQSTGGHDEGSSADAPCYVAALTVHLGVVVTGILVFKCFGKGLKEKLNRKQTVRSLQVRWVS